jgi:hypothetical protein
MAANWLGNQPAADQSSRPLSLAAVIAQSTLAQGQTRAPFVRMPAAAACRHTGLQSSSRRLRPAGRRRRRARQSAAACCASRPAERGSRDVAAARETRSLPIHDGSVVVALSPPLVSGRLEVASYKWHLRGGGDGALHLGRPQRPPRLKGDALLECASFGAARSRRRPTTSARNCRLAPTFNFHLGNPQMGARLPLRCIAAAAAPLGWLAARIAPVTTPHKSAGGGLQDRNARLITRKQFVNGARSIVST